ncbi:MAG: Uncharacterised protein [Cellulomonadaceae bacterium TMED98]|nr:MAG: Uncharacterised protein [Cellulomonadaceae bacterium TMED98]
MIETQGLEGLATVIIGQALHVLVGFLERKPIFD